MGKTKKNGNKKGSPLSPTQVLIGASALISLINGILDLIKRLSP